MGTYLLMREPGEGTLVFPPEIEILDLTTRYGKLRVKDLAGDGWEVCGRISTDLGLDDVRDGIGRPALDAMERMKDKLLKIERYIERTIEEER